MSWLEELVAAAMLLPPFLVPLMVFGSALVEYVFPPWWGDTFILLGFFLAARGGVSPAWVYVAAVAGSMIGSVLAYWLGRRYGVVIVQRMVPPRQRSKSWEQTRRLFRRFGERVLVLNRFLPIVRSVMLYAAGALNLRFWPTFIYCGISNLAFVGFLMWLGLVTAGSWEQLAVAAQRANLSLGIFAVVLVISWIAVTLFRNRRRPNGEDGC